MQDQLQALLTLACIGYGLYLAWSFLVLLVTAPRGSLSEAMAMAEVDEEEEDRQRRRRRREDDEELNRGYSWDDDE